MPIDPSIALSFKAPEFESPTNALAKMLQIQTTQQQNQLGQAKLDEYQRGVGRQNLVYQTMQRLGADATDDQRVGALKSLGEFDQADKVQAGQLARQKTDADSKKALADALKTGAETLNIKLQHHRDQLGPVNDPEGAKAWVAAMYQDPDLAPIVKASGRSIEQQIASIPTDPKQFAQWKLQSSLGADKLVQYTTPDANTVATNERIAAEGKLNRAKDIEVQKMIGARQDAGDAANSAFTPEAIANAAARYNVDGTLPPMGMGKAGSAGRAAILNEAARQKAGVDPTQQRVDQLGAKGEAQAKAASLRAYSAAGKEGQAIQATNTGLNHLDTVEQLAMAQKNGDVQLFNKLANQLGRATGQPAPTNLAAAITMVSPEVSKAVIGAAGGQQEREEFAKNFNPNGSPQQALQGIGVIKELMGGRLTEAQRTYERTVGKKDFRDTMLSPAAQRVLDRAHGASVAGASAGPAATNSKGWVLHTDARGNRAYVSPNGKDYEEVR